MASQRIHHPTLCKGDSSNAAGPAGLSPWRFGSVQLFDDAELKRSARRVTFGNVFAISGMAPQLQGKGAWVTLHLLHSSNVDQRIAATGARTRAAAGARTIRIRAGAAFIGCSARTPCF
jgi:hypothetical protein